MKKFLIFLIIAAHSVLTDSIHRAFMKELELEDNKIMFKKYHYIFEKAYDLNSEESIRKYKIFKENLKEIKSHNSKKLSWSMGLGPFTDYSKEEFSLIFNNGLLKREETENISNQILIKDNKFIASPDWSDIIPIVKDQYSMTCGGMCFAYTSSTLMEAYYNKIYNKYEEFSTLELGVCGYKSNNCNGGRPELSLKYGLIKGVSLENDYPTKTSTKQVECKKELIKPFAKIIWKIHVCYFLGVVNSPCSNLLEQGLLNGPVITGIDIDSFQHYTEGTVSSPDCKNIGHSVLAVQITENKIKFLNSFGIKWGINGYGYQKREQTGPLISCGMEHDVVYIDKVERIQ